jgi:acyl-CoA synthetase (NDP forming)
MDDDNVNGILLIMMFASANVDVVEGISNFIMDGRQKKPFISCISAPQGIWDAQVEILERSGALVNYPTPERAARAMAHLWKFGEMKISLKDLL